MSALRNVLFAVGFMTVGAVASVGAQATAGAYRAGPFGPGMVKFVASLDLNDQQQELVDEIKLDAREQMQAHREDRDGHKAEVKALLSQETIDADVVHDMIDTRVNDMSSMAHDMADKFITLHATLDDEQRATLVEKVDEVSERHEQRGQRGERGERGEQ